MPYKERPVERLFYTIGEVSQIINVPVSTVRFWANEFDILKPRKNKKGNRLFMPEDLRNLKIIHHLLKEKGMTIAGAKKYLAEKQQDIDYRFAIREVLLNIREMLVEIRNTI
ncbi:MAG: MerR family transcriptional regulator [Bacteroidales bacterium]|nr:MerR family transcriptional regulator [Bacteroidales bacterium]